MLFTVLYVCVTFAHTPTVAKPPLVLVTLGVGTAFIVTVFTGDEVPLQPSDVSVTLTLPLPDVVHTTVTLVPVVPP